MVVLESLLIPFAQECNEKRSTAGLLPMIVQENKTPSHNSKYQAEIFSINEICELLWPGNFSDLNMIEPAWPWIKRKTYKLGPSQTKEEAVILWKSYWITLPQSKIQDWVSRMPRHLRVIRFLKGDNKYKEERINGRTDTKQGKQLLI